METQPAPDRPSWQTEDDRPVSLWALRIALGRVPVWLITTALTVLLAAVAAAPWLDWFREATLNRYAPGALIRGLDEVFRFDTRAGRGVLEDSARTSGAVLALIAMLGGVFTAGGWLQVFLERTDGHSVRRFFHGGARYFFRFLAVLVLTLLSLALVGWVLYETPWEMLVHERLLGIDAGELEDLASEATVRRLSWLQDGLYLVSVGLVLAWGTYTRARLALRNGRSALWNGLCAWTMIFLHPVRTLRPMLLLLGLQVVVLAGAGWLTHFLQGRLGAPGHWTPVLYLFLVTLAVLMWRSVVRGASYHAALQVTSRSIRPTDTPDPWSESLGGPGGPRYPLGGDEFETSV